MLCNRLKQFREYNNLTVEHLADILKIDEKQYKDFESGKETPSIDIIEKLAYCYKVTVDEFYGYTPRLSLYNETARTAFYDDEVEEKHLRMSELSWDEAQLILYYRSIEEKDDIIREIIKRNTDGKNKIIIIIIK